MRKIIFVFSLFVYLFGFKAISYAPQPVYACINWGTPVCKILNADGSCANWYTPCLDIGNPGQSVCDSGYYSCNRATTDPSGHAQCCQVGSGGGGGVGYVCDWGQVDCPPGQTKNLTFYSDYCGLITGCTGAGSAQDNIPPGCGGTYCGDQKCTINQNGVEKCKCLQWNYRRQTIRTYGCVPTAPVCTPASPTAPTLSSPANGASLVDIAVDLIWNSTNFGTACTAPYSQYQIYLDQNNPPTTLIGTVAGGGKV